MLLFGNGRKSRSRVNVKAGFVLRFPNGTAERAERAAADFAQAARAKKLHRRADAALVAVSVTLFPGYSALRTESFSPACDAGSNISR